MKIVKIPSAGYESNCWLLLDEISGKFAVVDPSPSLETITEAIEKHSLKGENFEYVLLTHGHFDHIFSVDAVRDRFVCKVCIHSGDAEFLCDARLNANKLFFGDDIVYRPAEVILGGGDNIVLGEEVIKVIHTPGHTQGCVCYLTSAGLITGDTLFDMSIGRTDLPGGNTAQIEESLKLIAEMDGELKIYPGHGGISNIEKQRRFNPYLKGI